MAKSRKEKDLQSHGRNSKVYVPIIMTIFKKKYRKGCRQIEFTLDDIRETAEALGITTRNPGDVIYRMRSRTKLPPEILSLGFNIIKQVGRGKYRFEKAPSTLIQCPPGHITEAIDLTPLPVRRLLPEDLAKADEQAILSIVHYSGLLGHFTGLQVFRLRSHVRKSVTGVGQVEVDEVDVGIAMRDDEMPVILPIEAKASADAINRVQVAAQVAFAKHYFPGHVIRPIAIKVDFDSVLYFLEFNAVTSPKALKTVNVVRYRLSLSDAQRKLIQHGSKK
jgi:hypothetical protein